MSCTVYLPSMSGNYHLRSQGLTKMGLVYPVPLLSGLNDKWASCFDSHNSHARIRRKQHVRLTSTRRVVKRGYAASYFNSQSSDARIRYHPISPTNTIFLLTIALISNVMGSYPPLFSGWNDFTKICVTLEQAIVA